MRASSLQDVFGTLRHYEGPADTHFRFTGEQWDGESGFYYLRARYYDPAIGRFVSRDPWLGLVAVPQSLNRYAYVLNNPALYVDPYGYWGLGDVWDKAKDVAGAAGGGMRRGVEVVGAGGEVVLKGAEYCLYDPLECSERAVFAGTGVFVIGFSAGFAIVLVPVGAALLPFGPAGWFGATAIWTGGALLAVGGTYAGWEIIQFSFSPWERQESLDGPGKE